MGTIWRVFAILAVALVAGGLFGATGRGPRAPVFRIVGRGLLVLGVGTGVFPTLLKPLGPWIWAGAYSVFVAVVTVIMSNSAIRRARAAPG